jgi:hypothetical protein
MDFDSRIYGRFWRSPRLYVKVLKGVLRLKVCGNYPSVLEF